MNGKNNKLFQLHTPMGAWLSTLLYLCNISWDFFYVFKTAWFQSFSNRDRCPSFFSVTVHARCYPLFDTVPVVAGLAFLCQCSIWEAINKRPLICIVHGLLLICCQQLSLSSHGSPVSALMVILCAAVFVYTRP